MRSIAILPPIRRPDQKLEGQIAATSSWPSTAVAWGANRTFPPYNRVFPITISASGRSSVATPKCHVAGVRRSCGSRWRNANGYAPGPRTCFNRGDTCFAASASQPAEAISKNAWSPAMPISTRASCPPRWASTAARIPAGIPVSRHQMLTVPPGSAASAVSLCNSPAATSRIVPSPPSANTSGTPASDAACAATVAATAVSGMTNSVCRPRRSR